MDEVRKICTGNSKGVSAIEVIIALAILGIIAVAFLGGLSTALNATSIADERSVAQSLAQSQMEYIKSQDYVYDATEYDVISDVPDGYTIQVVAEPLNTPDDGIQKITITIKHQGNEVLTLEDYKVDR